MPTPSPSAHSPPVCDERIGEPDGDYAGHTAGQQLDQPPAVRVRGPAKRDHAVADLGPEPADHPDLVVQEVFELHVDVRVAPGQDLEDVPSADDPDHPVA